MLHAEQIEGGIDNPEEGTEIVDNDEEDIMSRWKETGVAEACGKARRGTGGGEETERGGTEEGVDIVRVKRKTRSEQEQKKVQ